MNETILVERDGVVATVALNRPDKMNALDLAGWQRLGDAFRELNADATLRCIVVRGRGGRAFGAGADISEFDNERSDIGQATRYGEVVETAMAAVAKGPHPTIALIQGVCVGGGLELACVCDLRICGASSRFGVPVSRLGLTMAYAELRAVLSVVGAAAAKEILLSGEVFGADRAIHLRLVNQVVADEVVEDEAYALARRISSGAPLVHRWHKQFIRRLDDPAPLTDDEIAEGYAAFATEDFRRGYRAFLDKVDPEFEGR